MGTYAEYRTLIDRCAGWSVPDLGDLLHEIERDRELDERERAALQVEVYRLIWDRSVPEMDSPSHGAAIPP